MRARRFRVSQLDADVIHVTGPEAVHALRVLRLEVGAPVELFDGRGAEVQGRIVATQPDSFDVRAERVRPGPVEGWGLVLAVAAPKGERGDWMVEKCAELGARAIVLIETKRGLVVPGEGKLARWRRKASEAAKQSGHSHLLEIGDPVPIARVGEIAQTSVGFFGDLSTDAASLIDSLQQLRGTGVAPGRAVIYIGSEGGWTDEETGLLRTIGARAVRMAGGVLRVETAAVCAASAWAGVFLNQDDQPTV